MPFVGVVALFGSRPVLVGGEERGHVCERLLVRFASAVDLCARVVEGAVAFVAFGVCAVPQFAHVLRVAVDVVQEGFEAVQVFVCGVVIFADFFVPVIGDEAGAGPAEADGDGHRLVVADVAREVCLLFVGERVPCVGERLHDGEVCGPGCESDGDFGDLVGLGGVHGWVSFSLVVGVFSCVGFSAAHCGRVCSLSRVKGGGEYALNADAGGADTVTRVNGGVVEGDFSADTMFGVRLDEVTGDAEIGDLNGLTEADGTVRQSRITLVSGDASVSRVGDYSAVGRVTGGDVWRVEGGNVYFVSGGGRVESVLSGGRVGAVESGGVVNWVTGEDASVDVVMGGMGSGEKPGIVRSVAGGDVVEHVGERGIVGDVEDGGTVGEVSGEGSVQRVKSGGRVDAVVKNAIVGDNEGVIGFVGSPAAPSSAAEGADEPGAWLATNRSGGVVEQVRGGGRVQKNAGTVEAVSWSALPMAARCVRCMGVSLSWRALFRAWSR